MSAEFLEPVEMDMEQNGQKFHTNVFFVKKEALTAWELALKGETGDAAEKSKETPDKNQKSDKSPTEKPKPAGLGVN